MSAAPPDARQGRPLLRRLSGRLLAGSIGIIVSLVALEFAVGRYFPVRAQVYRLDESLLHDARANAARIQPMHSSRLRDGDAARVYVATGAEGFRGASLETPKKRKRLLVLGDSFVMAENVPHKATFAVQLGRALDAELTGEASIEVVNAGRSGYGPDQSLLQLEQRFDEIEPDAIVHVLCAHNDFGDLMRNKLFRLDDAGELVRETPVIGQRMRDEFRAIEERASEPALVRLWKFWRDVDGTRALVNELSPNTLDLYLVALDAQFREHWLDRRPDVVTLFEDVYDADVALRPNAASSKIKVELMGAVLARLVEFAASKDVPLVFVIVPSAVDVAPGFGLRVDPTRYREYAPERLVDALRAAVVVAGGRAIDVSAALVVDGSADPSFVGGTDIHWNAGGQRRAAASVAGELRADDALRERLSER